MADNVDADTGVVTEPFATDEIGGVHYPRTKIVLGADGVNDGDLSASNPLPVSAMNTEQKLDLVCDLLAELAFRLTDIADSVGNMSPDTAGRIRVAAETLGTLSTITTMTNQAQMGGVAMNAYMATISQLSEGGLRRNVVIS